MKKTEFMVSLEHVNDLEREKIKALNILKPSNKSSPPRITKKKHYIKNQCN